VTKKYNERECEWGEQSAEMIASGSCRGGRNLNNRRFIRTGQRMEFHSKQTMGTSGQGEDSRARGKIQGQGRRECVRRRQLKRAKGEQKEKLIDGMNRSTR
jgi:hypothetical protein